MVHGARYVAELHAGDVEVVTVDVCDRARLLALFTDRGADIRFFHFESCTNPGGSHRKKNKKKKKRKKRKEKKKRPFPPKKEEEQKGTKGKQKGKKRKMKKQKKEMGNIKLKKEKC